MGLVPVRMRKGIKTMDISKSDWKLFRMKLADWQEKYMERLIKEYVTALTDETRLASDKKRLLGMSW